MSNRKLQEFDEYRLRAAECASPWRSVPRQRRAILREQDGSKTLMAERGTFMFRRYCVKGASKWIEAHRVGGGMVVLWVGKARPNPDLPSFKRRPYKIRKVTERKRKGGKKQEAGRAAVCAPSKRWARARWPQGRDQGPAGAKTSGTKEPNRGPSPKPKQGLPRPGGRWRKRGKNGVKEGQVEGKPFPLPLGLPQFEPGFYGVL